jgi:hypothetical protein
MSDETVPQQGDIVERLREPCADNQCVRCDLDRVLAADEIEELRTQLDTVKHLLEDHSECGPGECNVLDGVRQFLEIA